MEAHGDEQTLLLSYWEIFSRGEGGVFFFEIEIYVLHLSSSRDIQYLKKKYTYLYPMTVCRAISIGFLLALVCFDFRS